MPRTSRPSALDDEIHRLLGKRLRDARLRAGLSQEQMGMILGVTFQQVQKYETGRNRIAASRLYEVARALHLPFDYFFDGADQIKPIRMPTLPSEGRKSPDREASDLVRAFFGISNPDVRRSMFDLIRAAARSDEF